MKTRALFVLVVLVSLMVACSNTTISEGKSMNIFLQDSKQSSFVDFLYEFSNKNRLNVQWFGWHFKEKPVRWFERNDRATSFKVGVFLLSEDNGYFHFSNHTSDDSKIFFHLNYGDEKVEWLDVVEAFKVAVSDRGWVLEEFN